MRGRRREGRAEGEEGEVVGEGGGEEAVVDDRRMTHYIARDDCYQRRRCLCACGTRRHPNDQIPSNEKPHRYKMLSTSLVPHALACQMADVNVYLLSA